MPSSAADQARALQAQQDLERLQLALGRLPEELRNTLVLADIEGESCLSVAAALGVPVGTVYSRLHIARQKLQVALHVVDAARARQRGAAYRPERQRAAGMWSVGLLFAHTEAGKLLRVARDQPLPATHSEALLVRHHELVRAGADLHVASFAPHSASWLGVLGPGGIGAAARAGAAGIAAVLLIGSPSLPHAAAAPSLPLVAAAPRSPNPSSHPRRRPSRSRRRSRAPRSRAARRSRPPLARAAHASASPARAEKP